MLSRTAPFDEASGREKDACGQPSGTKLAGVRFCFGLKLTSTISFQWIIHLQEKNLNSLLLTQIPPSVRWAVEQVIRFSDILPPNMVDCNQVFLWDRRRVTDSQRPIFDNLIQRSPWASTISFCDLGLAYKQGNHLIIWTLPVWNRWSSSGAWSLTRCFTLTGVWSGYMISNVYGLSGRSPIPMWTWVAGSSGIICSSRLITFALMGLVLLRICSNVLL